MQLFISFENYPVDDSNIFYTHIRENVKITGYALPQVIK